MIQLSFNLAQLAFSCSTSMRLGPPAPKTLLESVGVGRPVNMASSATPFLHWPSTPRDVGRIHSAGPASRWKPDPNCSPHQILPEKITRKKIIT